MRSAANVAWNRSFPSRPKFGVATPCIKTVVSAQLSSWRAGIKCRKGCLYNVKMSQYTGPWDVIFSKKNELRIKMFLNPHHTVTNTKYNICSCTTYKLAEPNMRQFWVFTAPSSVKCASSVHTIFHDHILPTFNRENQDAAANHEVSVATQCGLPKSTYVKWVAELIEILTTI